MKSSYGCPILFDGIGRKGQKRSRDDQSQIPLGFLAVCIPCCLWFRLWAFDLVARGVPVFGLFPVHAQYGKQNEVLNLQALFAGKIQNLMDSNVQNRENNFRFLVQAESSSGSTALIWNSRESKSP